MNEGQPRIFAVRPFQPADRLGPVRLKQVNNPDASVPRRNGGLVWAEVDGLLEIRDGLIDRTGEELAPPKACISRSATAIERDCPFIFRNSLTATGLCEQNLPLHVMGECAVG